MSSARKAIYLLSLTDAVFFFSFSLFKCSFILRINTKRQAIQQSTFLKSSQFNKSSSSKKVVTSRRKATTTTKAMLSSSAGPATLEGYGSCSFKGAVADKYLKEQGYDASLLKDLSWPKNEAKAKAVAAALLSWATDNGAKQYSHWFQPMASAGRSSR